MYIGFYWMEQWLKMLSALNAEIIQQTGGARGGLQAQIAELTRTASEVQEALTSAERGREEREAEMALLRQRLSEAESKRDAAETARENRQSELTKLEQRLREAESARDAAKRECEAHIAELTQLRGSADDRASLQAEIEAMRQAHAAEISAFRQALDERDRLSAEAGDLTRRLHTAEIERDRLRAELEALRRPAAAPVAAAEPAAARNAAKEAQSAADLVIHVRKPADWSEPLYIHYWDTRPEMPPSPWPGLPMTPEAGGWFGYHLTGVKAASLVINDGAGHQSENVYRDGSGWRAADGRWHDTKPAER